MPRGQKVSPHHLGRRKTHFLVRTSTIFGADVHDPKGCRKTLYKKTFALMSWPLSRDFVYARAQDAVISRGLEHVWNQGSINGGFQTVVRVGPESKFRHPILTSILPCFTSILPLLTSFLPRFNLCACKGSKCQWSCACKGSTYHPFQNHYTHDTIIFENI